MDPQQASHHMNTDCGQNMGLGLSLGLNMNDQTHWTVQQRPALEMVGSDELKNLERVLMMNWTTLQQPQPQQPSPSHPEPQANVDMAPNNQSINPYLLQMLQQMQMQNMLQAANSVNSMPQPQTIQVIQGPPSPQPQPRHASNSKGQEQGFTPLIQYPFVPFWTACPLPFSPLAYPQIIIPPGALSISHPIGPHLLRPTNWQQMPMPNFAPQPQIRTMQPQQSQQAPLPSVASTSHTPTQTFIKTQPSTPKTEYEEALERYKTKRSKRKWTRAPEQRLSIQAQNKPRDEKGRFINAQAQKEECLKKQLDDLQQQLSRSQYESNLLRDQLKHTELELNRLKSQETGTTPKQIPDDMYLRQVAGTHPTQPDFTFHSADESTIYSPFRGGNAILHAFKEKVNFSQKKQDLRPINSPFLQAEFERQHSSSVDQWVDELLLNDNHLKFLDDSYDDNDNINMM